MFTFIYYFQYNLLGSLSSWFPLHSFVLQCISALQSYLHLISFPYKLDSFFVPNNNVMLVHMGIVSCVWPQFVKPELVFFYLEPVTISSEETYKCSVAVLAVDLLQGMRVLRWLDLLLPSSW